MLNIKHIEEIEKFRFDTSYKKYILIKLLNYQNEMLKELQRPQLDQECFCEETRKKQFFNDFYQFYDLIYNRKD